MKLSIKLWHELDAHDFFGIGDSFSAFNRREVEPLIFIQSIFQNLSVSGFFDVAIRDRIRSGTAVGFL